jgi:hypothetical protein
MIISIYVQGFPMKFFETFKVVNIYIKMSTSHIRYKSVERKISWENPAHILK